MITLRQLRIGIEALEAGSISACARRLGLSVSSVSIQLAGLEHALGSVLATRTGQGLLPTPAGSHFLPRAVDVLVEFQIALASIDNQTLENATLRVNYDRLPPGCALDVALRKLKQSQFCQRQRHLEVAMITDMPEQTPALSLSPSILDGRVTPEVFPDRWVAIVSAKRKTSDVEHIVTVQIPDLQTPHMTTAVQLCKQRGWSVDHIRTSVGDAVPSGTISLDTCLMVPETLMAGRLRNPNWARAIPLPDYFGPRPSWRIQRTSLDDEDSDGLCRELFTHLQQAIKDLKTGGAASLEDPLAGVETAHLSTFVEIMRLGSISVAARALGVTQPAATMRLHRFEELLDAQLFVRTAQGLIPTQVADRLFHPVSNLFDNLEQLRRQLKDIASPKPILRAGQIQAVSETSLLVKANVAVVKTWCSEFPDHTLQLSDGVDHELRRMLLGRAIDVAILGNNNRQSGLIVVPIVREPLVVVSNPNYTEVKSATIPLRCLNAFKLALPTLRHGFRRLLEQAAGSMEIKLGPAIEIDSLATNLHLVKSGSDFVTVLPLSVVKDDVTAGLLRAHSIVEPNLDRRISVARRSGEHLSTAAERYVSMFAQTFTSMLGSERQN